MEMRFVEPGGGCWPTAAQELLLDAATGRRSVADIWPAYERAKSTRHINSGEMRLYPLVASRLTQADRHQAYWSVLTRARMTALARHAVVRRHIDEVLDLLEKRGIEAIVMKGFAMIASTYRDGSLRPAGDIDIMVHPKDLADAIMLLQNLGARPTAHHPALTPNVLRYRSAGFDFAFPNAGACDIHIHPRKEVMFLPGVTLGFWKDGRRVDWDGRSWLVPSPNWLLVETILHGLRWNEVHAVRWVTDADRLIGDGAIDWEELFDLATRTRLVTLFDAALSYLAVRGTPVPAYVLGRLKQHKTSFLERWEYSLRSRRDRLLFGEYFPLQPINYWLRSPGSAASKARNFFPHYFDAYLGIASSRDFGAVIAHKYRARVQRLRALSSSEKRQ
jgi:hypothetical protein